MNEKQLVGVTFTTVDSGRQVKTFTWVVCYLHIFQQSIWYPFWPLKFTHLRSALLLPALLKDNWHEACLSWGLKTLLLLSAFHVSPSHHCHADNTALTSVMVMYLGILIFLFFLVCIEDWSVWAWYDKSFLCNQFLKIIFSISLVKVWI